MRDFIIYIFVLNNKALDIESTATNTKANNTKHNHTEGPIVAEQLGQKILITIDF
jgi:hypothetical protein